MLVDLDHLLARDVAGSEAEFARTLIGEVYILAITITAFSYNWLNAFVDELEFIWRKDCTLGKVAYIWMRTICVVFLSACYSRMCLLDVSNSRSLFFDGKITAVQTNLVPFLPWIYEALSSLVLHSSLVIQSMRVYAMYGQQRRMKIFLTCLVLASIAACAILYTYFSVHTNVDGDMDLHTALLKGFWGPQWLLIFALGSESIILALVLYKSWQSRGMYNELSDASAKDHLLSVMVSDSVKYYVAIFLVYAATLVVAFVGPAKENLSISALGDNMIMFIATACSGILSPRLILDLRREYYGEMDPSRSQEGARTLSWAAADRRPAPLNSHSGEEADDLESSVLGSRM